MIFSYCFAFNKKLGHFWNVINGATTLIDLAYCRMGKRSCKRASLWKARVVKRQGLDNCDHVYVGKCLGSCFKASLRAEVTDYWIIFKQRVHTWYCVCERERESVCVWERVCVKDVQMGAWRRGGETVSKWEIDSVTRKLSPNVYKSCPKMISLEKW